MVTQRLDLSLFGPERTPVPEATPQRLSAVLRWRTRWLRETLSPREALAARFLPALLQARFGHRDLRGEPPGIEGLTVRRSWGALARNFDLPPPIARLRGRALVAALLAVPAGPSLEIYALKAPGVTAHEWQRVAERLVAAESLVRTYGSVMRVVPLDTTEAAVEPLPRLIAFGALIAGRLPPGFWDPPKGAQHLTPGAFSRLVASAPSPLSATLLTAMSGALAELPGEALRSALSLFPSARPLADPELFSAAWAAAATGEGALLWRVLSMAAARPATREAASGLVGGVRPAFPGLAPERRESAAEVMECGRKLSLLCAQAVRRAPPAARDELRARVRAEMIAPGLPEVLLPALARSLETPQPHGFGLPTLKLVRDGRSFEVRESGGALLARAAAAEQAQARALFLVGRACGPTASAAAAGEDPAWRALASGLCKPVDRRRLLLAVEALDRPGGPTDPLNRGPGRLFGFAGTLTLLLRPDGRPTAWRQAPGDAADRLVVEASRGTAIDVRAASGEANPPAARLMRMAAFCRPENAGPLPRALEAGGKVVLLEQGRTRHFQLSRFANRPRACQPDAEAPDLSPWAEDGIRHISLTGQRNTITCHARPLDSEHAGIVYLDGQGFQLREEIPIALLGRHLEEAQQILRQPPGPCLLAVRYSRELQPLFDKFAAIGAEAVVGLEVRGSLPFGLQITLAGEVFGAFAPLGWNAAAQSVLSAWPSGVSGRLSCGKVEIDVHGRPAMGLVRLYARSAALRRLRLHMKKLVGP